MIVTWAAAPSPEKIPPSRLTNPGFRLHLRARRQEPTPSRAHPGSPHHERLPAPRVAARKTPARASVSSTPTARREPATTVALASPPPAPRRWSWPDLIAPHLRGDVLACPRCGGRMRVVATIEDPVV